MKTIISENQKVEFYKEYYIIQGNNGNHSGFHREWKLNSCGYDSKREANKVFKEMEEENGDIKYGLTPLRIVTPEDLIEILESKEKIRFSNCFDISANEI